MALTDRASRMSRCFSQLLVTQNNPTYSLALSADWNSPLAICFPKKQGPPSVVFEDGVQIGTRHFYPTTVFQLHALLITLQKTSTHLRKYLQELWRVVLILKHRHKVSIEGHQCVAGPSLQTDIPRSNAEKAASAGEAASALGATATSPPSKARTSCCA